MAKAAKTASKRAAAGAKRIPGHPHPEPGARRVRTAKGRRPYFFDDPNVDRLLAMVMALAGEVSVIRERLDTHERLAGQGKRATHRAIEDYEPDETAEAFRAQWRGDFVARVLRIVQAEIDQMAASGAAGKNRDEVVEDVSG